MAACDGLIHIGLSFINLPIDRTRFRMRARQVADAHEELTHDLSAGEPEVLLEQLHPFRLVSG